MLDIIQALQKGIEFCAPAQKESDACLAHRKRCAEILQDMLSSPSLSLLIIEYRHYLEQMRKDGFHEGFCAAINLLLTATQTD